MGHTDLLYSSLAHAIARALVNVVALLDSRHDDVGDPEQIG
jgi:hypothetical protein